jgi:biotin carboxyl carrier protein
MTAAQVVKLTATPASWANLSFEVGGIVQTPGPVLGTTVQAFDFTSLYSSLGSAVEYSFPIPEPGPPHPLLEPALATLRTPKPAYLLNSADLLANVQGSELMSLRAETIKAALDKACALRANVYFAKFANQDNIVSQIQANLNAASNYLADLVKQSTTQFTGLSQAYNDPNDPKTGVVYSTKSSLDAKTQETNTANSTVNNTHDHQDMVYQDYGYRMPLVEATAQNDRAQLSLMREQFAQFMAGQPGTNLGDVFTNELTAIDMDVKRLQVAYVNTILLPPISGTVTGVYKQVGDAVLPGETVLRIEDLTNIYLVGTVICRELVALGAAFTLDTTSLFSSGTNATVNGTVIAARGDPRGDDWWNVVISCQSPDGTPVVAPGCTFDYEDTTVTIA